LKQQGSRGEKGKESSRVLLDRFFNLEEIKAFTLLHHALMLSCSRKKRNSITPEAVHEKKKGLTRKHFAPRWEEVDDAFYIENFQGVSPLDLEYFMDWKYGGVPPSPKTSRYHFPLHSNVQAPQGAQREEPRRRLVDVRDPVRVGAHRREGQQDPERAAGQQARETLPCCAMQRLCKRMKS
jgi:hypothetical protein